MIEPVSVPIILDLELSDEGYNLEVDNSDEFSMELGAPIIIGTGHGLPSGGLEGQALIKKSDEDYDAEWRTIDVGNGLPPGGVYGDLIMKNSSADYSVEWITPASSAEQDNTRPITAAAVYTEIGNINALLATI